MSAWKSPLLYLGFVLILVAATALVAPLFVEWNAYRAQFEDYGRKLTGHQVTIAGPIEARLFPWPVLVLNQVTIANPEGTRRANLMEARRIEMGMSLAPLLSGQVEVESVAIDRPVFAFERLAGGAVSWSLKPEESLAALIDPDRVAVSEVSIFDGTVFIGDHRRGGLDRLDAFTGTLSAPALSGPWRMRASASHSGAPFEINLTTGKLIAGEAARVGLRIAPLDGAGMVFSFDGEVARPEGKGLKGTLKVTPTVSARGKSHAETGFRPFYLKADVEADYDTVALTQIEASPAFSSDPGNFITGAARIDLGSRIVIRTALSAARLDLDQIAGRRGQNLLRSGVAFDELSRILFAVPQGMELHVDLAASSMVAGGETLDASRLRFDLSPERLRIDEFTTAMPGQTRTQFSGLVVFGDDEPLMSGDLRIDSVSLRDFIVWAVPERRRDIEQVWNGIRGRLALDAKLDLAPRGVRLSHVRATLDDADLSGSLSFQDEPDPGLAVRIDADRVDLDRYLTRGLGGWAGDSGFAVTLIDLIGEAMTIGDFQLTAQAGQLRFHGVEAADIAIDLSANENGVEVRTIEIGRVGAARMDVAGVLRFPDEGVAGSIDALIDAEDPRGLLRLLGAFGPEGETEPAWAAALGPLDVRLVAEAGAEERITTASMALTGTAGEASAILEGRFHGELTAWQDAEVEIAGELDARSSALVAAITGLHLPRQVQKATRLSASLAGSLNAGLATSVEVELFGAQGQFAGTVRQGRRTVAVEGRAAVLAQEAAGLFGILGMPTGNLGPQAQVLAGESEIRYDGRGLRLSGLSGTAAGAAFSGDLDVVLEPVRRVSGQITTGKLSLPWLLGSVLLPRDGTAPALSSHFAATVPPMEANVTIAAERLELLPHIAFEDSTVDFKLGRYDLSLRGRGTGPRGEPAEGRIDVQLDRRGVVLDGAVEGPIELGALLRANDGSQVLQAGGHVSLSFKGSGRSPAGVLAALQAEGTYSLPGGVLKRVDPQSFARDLAAAKQPTEIDGLFTGSLRSGDMAFVGGSGTVNVANGVLTTKPLTILAENITGEAQFVLEAASGEIDLSFILNLTEFKDIPTFELVYSGAPRALEPYTDAQTLKSYLSMKMLQESVRQLEELQRQERELIEEEERFQRQQLRREQERRLQQQRGAEPFLDRKERELHHKIEQRRAEERQAEESAGESVIEPQPEPIGAAEPAAARSNAVIVSPLDPPLPGDTDPQAMPPGVPDLPVPPGVSGALVDPAPLPQVKPQRGPDTASYDDTADDLLRLPLDGHLGRVPEPVFSGPTILQPSLSSPHSGAAESVR